MESGGFLDTPHHKREGRSMGNARGIGKLIEWSRGRDADRRDDCRRSACGRAIGAGQSLCGCADRAAALAFTTGELTSGDVLENVR